MARNGITYADVATACEQLIAENKNPTIEGVRSILQTGSITTINKHLKLWKEQQGIHAKLEHELPESLLITVKGLHQAMTAEANSKVETLEAQHSQAVKELKAELTSLQQHHNQTLQTNRQLEQDKAELTEEKAALERHIEAQKDVSRQQEKEMFLLNERLHDKKADIENLHQQLKSSQTNLEHYREATRQEREQERLSFDEKVSLLEQSLRKAQDQVVMSRAEVAQLQQAKTQLTSDLAKQIEISQKAQNKIHAQELKLHQEISNYNQLEKEFDTMRQRQGDFITQAEADKATLQELTLQTERASEKIKGLEKALAKAEDTVTALTDKNLFLAQEKAELAITLARLEKVKS